MNIESIKPGIWIAYATVLVLLLLGSGATRVLINRFPERDYTELRLRVRTWWMIAVPVAATLVTGKALTILLLAAVSALALKEYLTLVATRHPESRALWFVYLAIPVQYWLAYRSSYVAFAAFIPLFVLVTLPIVTLAGHTTGFLRAAGAAYLGLVLTVFSVSHVALLLMQSDAPNPAGGATGLVVFLLLITQLNDVAQYVFGKCFGRRRITPRISPGKTVEGFAGGVLASAATAFWISPLLTPMDSAFAMTVGALMAAAGFCGDVAISAIKRDFNVKDTGDLLPGLGGILDRIDSLLCAAPLFFYFIHFTYYAE
jgi:phosphatidate cytidylyltransferase